MEIQKHRNVLYLREQKTPTALVLWMNATHKNKYYGKSIKSCILHKE